MGEMILGGWHRISNRPALDWEHDSDVAAGGIDRRRAWGCFVMALMPCAYAVGALGAWAFPGLDFWLASALGYLLLAAGTARAFTGWLERYKVPSATHESAETELEILEIKADAAVDLRTGNTSATSAIVMNIGEGKLLLLKGEWLRRAESFGAELVETIEKDPRTYNRLAEPFAFPAAHFELTRWSETGQVLSVEVIGDYLKPLTPGVEVPRPTISVEQLPPVQSLLLDGDLGDLDSAFESIAVAAGGAPAMSPIPRL